VDIAEKTDLLFKMITKDNGREYSYRDIETLAEGAVSSTSIWKVRIGKTKNPGHRMLQSLSDAFQVPVSYFFAETIAEEDIPKYQEQYRSEKLVEQISFRSHELDDEGKKLILDMISYVKKQQDGQNE